VGWQIAPGWLPGCPALQRLVVRRPPLALRALRAQPGPPA
jgi:hypothetical protein